MSEATDNNSVQHVTSGAAAHTVPDAGRSQIIEQTTDISLLSSTFAPIENRYDDEHLAEADASGILRFMGNRHIQRYMAEGRRVLLGDGRTGRIVRIDTSYPLGETRVSVWVGNLQPSGIAEVTADDVVGLAPLSA